MAFEPMHFVEETGEKLIIDRSHVVAASPTYDEDGHSYIYLDDGQNVEVRGGPADVCARLVPEGDHLIGSIDENTPAGPCWFRRDAIVMLRAIRDDRTEFWFGGDNVLVHLSLDQAAAWVRG